MVRDAQSSRCAVLIADRETEQVERTVSGVCQNSRSHRESGRRYIESPANGWRFYLFVRTNPDAPYAFCGLATYQSHEGDRPIAITWLLDQALPAALYQQYATLMQG